jgi:L,D-peptidoglycan transpeptidase YkuD (ErfK/YbiS/YcfS/YnhG family)
MPKKAQKGPRGRPGRLRRLIVRPLVGHRAQGTLSAGAMRFRCALGPTGIVFVKREGDGGTPRANMALRRLFRRADRGPRPPTGLPVRTTKRTDGWCDAAGHRRYNTLVQLPFSDSHETMWRDDGLYDLLVELGWNDAPATPGRGSAIFLHAARPGFTPTAGCVALEPHVLRRIVARLGPKTRLEIAPSPRKAKTPR